VTKRLPRLLRALAAHARQAPGRTAVVDGERALSYLSLHDQAEKTAMALVRRGAGPDQRIGVVGHKTVDTVIAILAVLRSGAAYVPLDPHAPAARNAALIADAGCTVVLASGPEGADFGRWAAAATNALPLSIRAALSEPDGDPLPPGIAAADIAYCMFTSGSTGRPKGVQIPHRALDAFFTSVHPLLGVEPGARCMNTSAFHFDVSVVDVLYPLARGATVFLTPAVPLPPLLTGLIARERITHMAAVGSTLALLADRTGGFRDHDISSLRRVMTGAEVLSPEPVRRWLTAAPGAVVINGYGPTEATCLVIAYPITEREPTRDRPYPVGRPLSGVRVLFQRDDGLTDARGPGEILLAGDQVMTGYLGQPGEDERAFTTIGDSRFYRTGDLGHLHEDGDIRFAGRRDDEIKIRGYRVNLQEVRQALESHELIGRAFVCAATAADRRPVLVCAVVPRDPGRAAPAAADPRVVAENGPLPELDPGQARSVHEHLAARLPRYMIPADYRLLTTVPVLSSGKPDSAAIRQRLLSGHREPR
jgi:amino acid adenylation domain-containing protein